MENPTVRRKSNRLGITRLGVEEVGQEAQGNQNNLHGWASKTQRGGGGHRAPTSLKSHGFLLVPARLLEPWSWGLLQAGSQPALSHWKHPPRRDKETRRARQASGAIRLLVSLSYRSASVPQRPLTRMQAATTSATVETRFFPTLTPTPADLHQLSFQHKPKGSSREPPPPQPRPDTRAEVTRTRSTH